MGITSQQLAGLGRDLMKTLGTAGGVVGGLIIYLINNPAQAETLLDALKHMNGGTAAVLAGLGTLFATAGIIWTGFKNSPTGIALTAARELPPGTTIVTTKEIAAATPSQANIVSDTEHAVVPKT